MDAKLTPDRVKHEHAQTPGWELAGEAIRRKFSFADFVRAIAFVNKLAEAAEAADHHPDILIEYKHVTLTLSTHSAGGLTAKDFALAREINELAV